MPMSDYVRALRAKIGSDLIEVPTVSVLVMDETSRVLLVRHVEGNMWTTPGGMVEPLETPADAALRETWEETGLLVALTRIVGVFGGPRFRSNYANGDRISFVATVFAARPVSGVPTPDGEETLEVRFLTRDDLATLAIKPHVAAVLDHAFAPAGAAYFDPPTWSP